MTGVLPVDKPAGPTSHDVVARARKALQTRRIGHTGTLDPFATGLLLLCIGPATRLAEYLTGMDKSYEAEAHLGVRTDTLDRDGVVVAEDEAWKDLSEPAIREAFQGLAGPSRQVPPAFSAKKVGGKRAYRLAREGRPLTLDPVAVEIHTLDVQDVEGPRVRFAVRCSSGTYIRALARDAGDALGVGAHLTALRRTAVGPFSVSHAVPLDALGDDAAVTRALLSPLQALGSLPRVDLDADQTRRVGHGQSIEVDADDGLVALAARDRLAAVAEVSDGAARPRKVFL